MAAAYLEQLHYRIVCRNYRSRYGEIDIIAEKEGTVFFAEVKARRSSKFARPADNITPRKRQQIARMAAEWFAEQGQESMSALLVVEVFLQQDKIEIYEDFLCG